MTARLIHQWSLGFKRTLTHPLFLISLPLCFFAALALVGSTRAILPPNPAMPIPPIASSYVIHFAALALLLCMLPVERQSQTLLTPIWLAVSLLAAVAFGGFAICAGNAEPLGLSITLWALSAGMLAVFTALHGMLAKLTHPKIARQALLLVLGLLMTTLFWTREPIQTLTRAAAVAGPSTASMILADSVMKLAPTVTLAGVWHQESGAAQSGREGNRFDLVRAPLSYEVWIGSYQILPYPRFWPGRDGGLEAPFNPGLILALLAWSIPLLILTDVLAARSVNNSNLLPFKINIESSVVNEGKKT